MITEDRVERAVEFLRDTSEPYGQMRGRVAYAEGNLRRVRALEMLEREGGLGMREAEALASSAYLTALEDQQNAVADFETLRAQREAAMMTIEVWRSQNSTRRQGL